MLNRIKILNRFTTTGSTISVPINMDFGFMDNSELVDVYVDEKVEESVNPIIDNETEGYTPTNGSVGITFRFLNITISTSFSYTNSFLNVGTKQDTTPTYRTITSKQLKSNAFLKSFFRLKFYDSDDINTRRLLFTEIVDTKLKQSSTTFTIKRLHWLKNDPLFEDEEILSRRVYMTAEFINKIHGKLHTFFNIPNSYTQGVTYLEYISNLEWRSAPIDILNPINNNGEYKFEVVDGVGGNTSSTITMSEVVLSQ